MVQEQIDANRQKLIDAGKENLLPENRSKLRRKQVEARMQQKDEVDVATQPENTTKIGNNEVIDTAKISENAVTGADRSTQNLMTTDQAYSVPPPPADDKPEKDKFGFPKQKLQKGKKIMLKIRLLRMVQ